MTRWEAFSALLSALTVIVVALAAWAILLGWLPVPSDRLVAFFAMTAWASAGAASLRERTRR